MKKTKEVEIKVRIINPEAIPQANINFTKAIAKLYKTKNA